MQHRGPIEEFTDADWRRLMATNLDAPFFLARAVIPAMKARRAGKIVILASMAGRATSTFGGAHYTASKAGLFGLTKTLAREAAFALRASGKLDSGMGVTVNTVTPGLIETDMVATIPPFMLNKFLEDIPMHRMGQPDEIGRVVCFLAQDASAYITGQIWGVNGGIDM